jgi:hypothetical protein
MSPRWPRPRAGTAMPSGCTYAERLLDDDLPWTRMRQVCRLLGLVRRRYGPGPVDTVCARALDLDVVNVTKIASMLEKATENAPPPPRPAVAAATRFARDPAEYRTVQLTLIGGQAIPHLHRGEMPITVQRRSAQLLWRCTQAVDLNARRAAVSHSHRRSSLDTRAASSKIRGQHAPTSLADPAALTSIGEAFGSHCSPAATVAWSRSLVMVCP